MNDITTLPAPVLPPTPAASKWEREHQAFLQMLPQLLATHRGQYAAVHEGEVVAVGPEKMAVLLLYEFGKRVVLFLLTSHCSCVLGILRS